MAILYTAHTKATGGREGTAETDNKAISVRIVKPGSSEGTNPEQLFGCAYAACFGGAVGAVAKNHNKDASKAEVQADINLNKDDKGFFISAALNVVLPGIDKNLGETIVKEAHAMCPYSKAVKGNVQVTLKLNGQEI
jgi:Ohr subfamily peroxiredoxin